MPAAHPHAPCQPHPQQLSQQIGLRKRAAHEVSGMIALIEPRRLAELTMHKVSRCDVQSAPFFFFLVPFFLVLADLVGACSSSFLVGMGALTSSRQALS